MRRLTAVAIAALVLVSVLATGVGSVAGSGVQQSGVTIHDATISTPSIEQGETFQVSVDFTNTHSTETWHNVSVKANGAELEKIGLIAVTGDRETQGTTIYDTEVLEPGTYTITVGDTDAGQLQVTESEESATNSDSDNSSLNGFLGPVGKVIGAPLMGLGVIFFLGAFGIEIIRGYKEYLGGGSEKGMKPAIVSLLIGSFGMFTGGILFGGSMPVFLAFSGLIFLIVFGVLFGGYYGVLKLYQEL